MRPVGNGPTSLYVKNALPSTIPNTECYRAEYRMGASSATVWNVQYAKEGRMKDFLIHKDASLAVPGLVSSKGTVAYTSSLYTVVDEVIVFCYECSHLCFRYLHVGNYCPLDRLSREGPEEGGSHPNSQH